VNHLTQSSYRYIVVLYRVIPSLHIIHIIRILNHHCSALQFVSILLTHCKSVSTKVWLISCPTFQCRASTFRMSINQNCNISNFGQLSVEGSRMVFVPV